MLAWGWVLVALPLIAGSGGCSSTGPDPYPNSKPVHPVKGQVLVNNQPAAGAFVLLVPVNEPPTAPDPRPRAEVGDDGSFVLSTYGSEDGAPAGEYVVTITWSDPDNPDRLQGRYSNPKQSPLRVTIKEGANDLPPYKL